ncbi:MAG: hypothetical protein ABI347_01335 [Nitrososphaera sp.]
MVFRASVNPLTDNFLELYLAGIIANVAFLKDRAIKMVKVSAA